ncbi:hypothetical protein NC653_028172 [Populus alba x Populus x berolinensis]|uniref:Uncharacterized protein n=1 Tax=Populus alba x Populus x berolinensis TaxID=444605 RepID=A0AAD6Q5W2_9ROSI|nr:hypothetical protein NC653_028172 [Populus alba x Populus x berolinensis]
MSNPDQSQPHHEKYSARHLSTKIINIASEFSPWKLAEVAAIYLTPFYRQLCHSGDLGALNEELVDMIRDASRRAVILFKLIYFSSDGLDFQG